MESASRPVGVGNFKQVAEIGRTQGELHAAAYAARRRPPVPDQAREIAGADPHLGREPGLRAVEYLEAIPEGAPDGSKGPLLFDGSAVGDEEGQAYASCGHLGQGNSQEPARGECVPYQRNSYSAIIRRAVVFRTDVIEAAPNVIVLHNHPSMEPSPSPDDIAAMEDLVTAARLLRIDLLEADRTGSSACATAGSSPTGSTDLLGPALTQASPSPTAHAGYLQLIWVGSAAHLLEDPSKEPRCLRGGARKKR